MKILITGGSGLLGSKIAKYAKEKFEVIATYLTHPISAQGFKAERLDIRSSRQTTNLIEKYNPDVVVHSAALVNVDYSEKHHEEARLLNVGGTKNVANACKKIDCKMVYISTAGIFDGKRAPYSETARPNPLNYYAKTKLEGEWITSSSLTDYMIIRTTVPYGWHSWKLNYVTWIIDSLKKGIPIRIVTDQRNTPTYADDFAKALLRLFELDKKGIFNVVGSTSISRFDFAMKVTKTFDLDKSLITPVSTEELAQVAPRPSDDSLKIDKILKLGIRMSTIDEGLQKMKKEKFG
jgi:dTDP-4-dehydrorhamnose reductase